ncbi:MAG: MATE family efflux transporter [Bacteroidales bacterium]|nr:MATE family efflux transporter [Bacteroidales bacterium]
MNRKILLLSIPNILTNITIPLLGMVDLGLMGHMGGSLYVGAIAVGGMIFNFLFWGFGFLRMGTSGFTAQAYGRRDFSETTAVLVRGITTALAGGVLLILMQVLLEWIAFRVIVSSPEVSELARQYFRIRIYAAPATLVIYVLTGWFIGMQNARFPMVLAVSVNLLNIGFSLLFIRVFGKASDGIAWANVCSQYTGLLLGSFLLSKYLVKQKKYLHIAKALNRQDVMKFIHVNKDIFIRTLCLIFTLTFFTAKSAASSDKVLAVNTLLFQLFYFFSYFTDGFAYAAEALTGKYIGAGDKANLKHSVSLLFRWGLGIALLFTIVYALFGRLIISMLTNDLELQTASGPYLIWVILVPFVTFAAFVWDGIYVGATASRAMRNSMLIITTVIFLPAYYLLTPWLGNHGLWIAMLLFMGSRGLFLTAWSKKAVFNLV